MVVDKHPPDVKSKQFSHCWCPGCGKLVYMTWIAHGEKKECTGCNLFYGPDGVQLVPQRQALTANKNHDTIERQTKGKQDEGHFQSSF